MKDELNEKNKLRSPRKLLKTISNGTTSLWPFVSFKRKFVQNQIGKVKLKSLHNIMHVFTSILTNKK